MSPAGRRPSGPLDGVRVVDLSQFVAGPLAGLVLAEQGAEVIKVEPVHGESFRGSGTMKDGVGAWWYATNRSKRSLAVNLKSEEGLAAVHDLVREADVLVHNFRIGVVERLGLGWEQMRALNPRLVYASLSGLGSSGPMARQRVYDNIVQAFSGVQVTQGGRGAPDSVRTPLADKVAPLLLAQAITAALLERERSGLGQRLETSMLHATLWWMWSDMLMDETFLEGEVVRGDGPRDYQSLAFETADGYLTTGASTDAEFTALAGALKREDWLSDPEMASQEWRNAHRTEFFRRLAGEIAQHPSAELLARLAERDAQGVPVNEPGQAVREEQVLANHMVAEIEDPELGRMLQPTPPVTFSRTPAALGTAPALGADTVELLARTGRAPARIAAMLENGVVAAPRARMEGTESIHDA